MSSFIARILAGEQLCPGEIPHHNGHMILAHLQEHEDGRCRRTGSGGHFHPMSLPTEKVNVSLIGQKNSFSRLIL